MVVPFAYWNYTNGKTLYIVEGLTKTVPVIDRTIEAIKRYYIDCKMLPSNSIGLSALVKIPEGCNQSMVKSYLKKLPKDFWGVKLNYEKTGERSFKVISYGYDGLPGKGDHKADRDLIAYIPDIERLLKPCKKIDFKTSDCPKGFSCSEQMQCIFRHGVK